MSQMLQRQARDQLKKTRGKGEGTQRIYPKIRFQRFKKPASHEPEKGFGKTRSGFPHGYDQKVSVRGI
jgi:hypothetical protein